ncbi:hypothetical protein T459_03610 [Capsicum annuum]|uniref:Uncharacterized protein n=1 Tax=Capsicum annuum TaxID=4072 RepID=A0A2G3AND8_CAPAN|nr:hypothetical protein T459_03610 [Capsicum annuum]
MSFSELMASVRQEIFVEKKLYRLGGIPQVLNVWMFELCLNVDTKVAVKEGNNIPRILNWRVVAVRPQFNQFMTEIFSKVSGTVSAHLSKSGKDVSVGRRSENKEQSQTRASKGKQTADAKQKNKEIDDSTRTNRKELLVKADFDSLEFNIKAYVKTYIRLYFVNPYKFLDDGIEKLSDIVVEEMKLIDSVFPVQEHEMALTIYKPPPTTPDEYMISDTAIVTAFPTPKKTVSKVKKTPVQRNRKPSKIFRSSFLTHFGSSTKGKKKNSFTERKRYPFEGYDINGNSPNVEMEVFEEWIKEDLYRDCGVFVDVYAEYLSQGLDIPSLRIDAHYHRLRYASLLCKYGSVKAENEYFSKNDDPQRSRMKFTPKETDRVLRIQ